MRLFRDDLINIARDEVLFEDKKHLKKNKRQLQEVIDKASKVEHLLSEPGWKTLQDLFIVLYKRTEYKIRSVKDSKERDVVVSDQKAIMSIWNLIRDRIQSGKSARNSLTELVEAERSEDGLPQRIGKFNL